MFTGDATGAWTDANVMVTLHGTLATSPQIPLAESQTHKNKFESGQVGVV